MPSLGYSLHVYMYIFLVVHRATTLLTNLPIQKSSCPGQEDNQENRTLILITIPQPYFVHLQFIRQNEKMVIFRIGKLIAPRGPGKIENCWSRRKVEIEVFIVCILPTVCFYIYMIDLIYGRRSWTKHLALEKTSMHPFVS
jgi:hypothetical protein